MSGYPQLENPPIQEVVIDLKRSSVATNVDWGLLDTRHANIEGWPNDPPAQLARQQELASRARLILWQA